MAKHVHAEVIKAWADGAEIEWLDNIRADWIKVVVSPSWNPEYQYRVKPTPEVFYARIWKFRADTQNRYECDQHPTVWSREKGGEDNIKATWEGDKLVSVEVIK